MTRSNSVCVLASGGTDSAVLISEALKTHRRVFPLFVRAGHPWETAEIHWLKKFLKAIHHPGLIPLTIVSIPAQDLYGSHWSINRRRVPGYRSRDASVYLPGRNIFLLSKAAVFCSLRRIPKILIGTLSGNPFPDSTPAFFRAMEKALREGLSYKISIQAPFRHRSKEEVVRRGRELPLHLSFSCLNPRNVKPCGRCNKCAERDKVLRFLSRSQQIPHTNKKPLLIK